MSLYSGKMKILLLAVLLFLGSGIPAAAQDGQEQPKPLRSEDLLPSGTYLFVKCSGIDQLIAERETLDLFKIWKEPEIQAFFADALEVIPELLEEEEYSTFPFQEVWNLCRGEIGIALCREQPIYELGAAPAAAITLDLGTHGDAFIGPFSDLLGRFAWARSWEQGSKEYQGHEIQTLHMPREGIAVFYTFLENHLVVTLDGALLEDILDRRLHGKPHLADDPNFSRCLSKAAGDGVDFLVYADVKTLLNIVKPLLPLDLETGLDVLGCSRAEALCAASTLQGGGSRDSFYLACPGEKTGLLAALSPRPVSGAALSRTPPDTLFFFAMAMEGDALLKTANAFLEKVLPAYHEIFRQWLGEFQQATGLDLEYDILGSLGGEVTHFVSMPSGGMTMIPDFFFTYTIEDTEAFKTVLDKFLVALKRDAEVIESNYAERVMYTANPRGLNIPISPTFVIDGGRLIISSTTMAMKKYLRWLDKGEGGLVESQDFGDTMMGVPENASMLCFVNLRRGLEIGYGAAAPIMPALMAQSELPFDVAMLPMAEAITSNISNASGYLVTDEGGVLFTGKCSIGPGALLSLAVSSLDYVMEKGFFQSVLAESPAVTSARVSAPQQDFNEPQLGEAYTLMLDDAYEGAERRLTYWIDNRSVNHRYMVWAHRQRGDCRLRLGRYGDAVTDYEFVAERDRDSRSQAFYEIARAYSFMDEKDKAVDFLVQAIIAGHKFFEEDPNLGSLQEDPQCTYFMDMVMTACHILRDGEHEEAVKVFTEWIFENPYHGISAWAYKNRGDCYLAQERVSEAVSDFVRAAEMEEAYRPQIYYNIACIYSLQDERDEAVEFLKKALDAGFSDFELMDYDGDLDNIRNHPKFEALLWRW